MDNVETVKNIYRGFIERNEALVRAGVADDVVWVQNEGFPGGQTSVGKEAVMGQIYSGLRGTWTAWRTTIEEYIDAGDTVIAIGKYEGTHATTGKSFTARFAHVFRLRKGQVARFDQFTDTAMIVAATS